MSKSNKKTNVNRKSLSKSRSKSKRLSNLKKSVYGKTSKKKKMSKPKTLKISKNLSNVKIMNFEFTGDYKNINNKTFVTKYYHANNDLQLLVKKAMKTHGLQPDRMNEIVLKNSNCKVNKKGDSCTILNKESLFKKHNDYLLMVKGEKYNIISYFSFYVIPEGNELEMIVYNNTSNSKKVGLFRTLEIKDRIPIKQNNVYVVPCGTKYKINILDGIPGSKIMYISGTIQI
jgi:hypothetical protein